MLKITVEGNKEEIRNAKIILKDKCFHVGNCSLGEFCTKCKKKPGAEIKYVIKEDK